VSCDHVGGQSGAALYVRGSGRVRLVLVCDMCGAVQGELGAFDYKPHPALPPGVGDPSAPDSGSSPAAA
jgi:hypothetical protein